MIEGSFEQLDTALAEQFMYIGDIVGTLDSGRKEAAYEKIDPLIESILRLARTFYWKAWEEDPSAHYTLSAKSVDKKPLSTAVSDAMAMLHAYAERRQWVEICELLGREVLLILRSWQQHVSATLKSLQQT